VMHACGHDGHVAIGLTVAKILAEEASGLSGRIMMLFQPAEEGFGNDTGMTCGGAEAMIAEGVLERFQPDAAVALHLWNELQTGHVVIHQGALMAGADMVTITIHGKGGHGALPNLAVDPVIAAALVLINLQTIVSRNVSPLETVVVSITEFHAGETLNVIPSEAILRGTMRTFSQDTRQLVMNRIEEISTSIAGGLGCKAEVEIKQLAPAVVNDAAITEEIIQSVQRHNPALVINEQFKVMVSEDMAFFLEKVPGCYILVGAAGPAGTRVEKHHHPKFNFDEQAMSLAVALLTGYASDYLALS
ncbi:MAG: amidohydrolase, partial [Anaerolinea sp.]|nr:amidohydrolase [Anaerolinea sp.]